MHGPPGSGRAVFTYHSPYDMSSIIRYSLSPVAVTVLIASVGTEAEPEFLATGRAANRAAIESIHSFACRMTVTKTAAQATSSVAAHYWRAGDKVRAKAQKNDRSLDVVVKDQKKYTLTTIGGQTAQAFLNILASQDEGVGEFDAWSLGMLTLTDRSPPHRLLFVNEYIEKYLRNIKRVAKKNEEGRDYLVVELTLGQTTQELWLDPRANYLMARVMGTTTEKGDRPIKTHGEKTVTRFSEIAPAVFFPERITSKYYTNDSLDFTEEVVFSDIVVNRPLPPGMFDLRIPAYTEVRDYIQDQQYKVDASGARIGPAREIPKLPPPVAGEAAGPQSETKEEPKSWTRWVLPSSLAILVIAGVLWLVRNRHDSREG